MGFRPGNTVYDKHTSFESAGLHPQIHRAVLEIPEVPYTISGKKTESPVKKIMMGLDPTKVIKKDALKNPSALNYFIELAKSN